MYCDSCVSVALRLSRPSQRSTAGLVRQAAAAAASVAVRRLSRAGVSVVSSRQASPREEKEALILDDDDLDQNQSKIDQDGGSWKAVVAGRHSAVGPLRCCEWGIGWAFG